MCNRFAFSPEPKDEMTSKEIRELHERLSRNPFLEIEPASTELQEDTLRVLEEARKIPWKE